MDFPILLRDATMTEDREVESGLSVMGEDEFRSFYERTARPLWAYLSRLTGDPHKADDFLQEAYYRFFRAAARHESESHRRNSLFRIATNLVRDAARHNKRYEEIPLDDDTADGADVPFPERQASARKDLQHAMGQLQPVQRELLWLAYAQGASHKEIAEILGVRAISVRTLLIRARRKFASILAPEAQR